MIGYCSESPDGIHVEVVEFFGDIQRGICKYCKEIADYGSTTPKVSNFRHGIGTNDPMSHAVLPFSNNRKEVRRKFRR